MKGNVVATSKTMDGFPQWLILLYGAIFAVLLYVIFLHNAACLLMSQDGNDWLSIFKSQEVSRQPFSQLGVDPLEGNFAAYPGVSREYFVPEALALLFAGSGAGKVFTYTVYGMMIMLSAFALARTLNFSPRFAFFTGASCAAMTLPTTFSGVAWVYPVYNLVPFATQSVCFATLIIACFWAIDAKRRVLTAAVAIVAVALVVLSVAANVSVVALMLPAVAVYGGASIFQSRQRSALLTRTGAAIACIGVPAALGMVQYAIVTAVYTSYYYFDREFMQVRASLEFASIFFHGGLGTLLVVVGMLGALCCAVSGPSKARIFATTHVVTTILFLPVSFLVVRFAENYHGPSPIYFEYMMWPIIFLFNCYAIFVAARAAAGLLSRWRLHARPWARTAFSHSLLIAVPLFLVGWNGWALAAAHRNTCALAGYFPVRPNPITDHLQDAIALKAGRPFRGLAATFADVQGKTSADWITLAGDDAYRSVIIGNDMRTSDLWLESIPTLMQYGPLISPLYYLVLTEFLSRPTDKQVRNSLVLTQPNERMLQLWGVRFLITDFVPSFGEVKARLAVPGANEFRLVELVDPNLGNYSPTLVAQAGTFREGLMLMKKPDYDGRSTLVTDAALQGQFVAATDVKLIYQKTGFTLSAASAGRSILVLPIQYSRCWSVSGEGNPFLFRANLMQLGVGFTGRLDATLTFRFGPFFASSCRLQDIRDMDRLQIRSARTW